MLTDAQIRGARPRDKSYRIADGLGLTLVVNPDGSKFWRFRYRFASVEKCLSLGRYGDVSLADARHRRDMARKLLAAGKDPSEERKREQAELRSTFRDVGEEWFVRQQKWVSQATVDKTRWLLDEHIYPELGSNPIRSITALDALRALRRIEEKGLNETAHRARQKVSAVLKYAVMTARAERDVTTDLPRGALAPVAVRHRAAITHPETFGGLLNVIDGYSGQPVVKIYLQILARVFTRPGELRLAQWSEFELGGDKPTWCIPAERMKMRREHVVPLARQAIMLLEELQALTGHQELLFPSPLRSGRRGVQPISDAVPSIALKGLGIAPDKHTAHGFRVSASTMLHEQGYSSQVIELCLAHKDTNAVRAIYNRSERLAERRELMQAWADYIDGLKAYTHRSPETYEARSGLEADGIRG